MDLDAPRLVAVPGATVLLACFTDASAAAQWLLALQAHLLQAAERPAALLAHELAGPITVQAMQQQACPDRAVLLSASPSGSM